MSETETTVLDEMREHPPQDREGWVELAQRIAADLSDAKADLAAAQAEARMEGKFMHRAEYAALQDEIRELKLGHQSALMAASVAPKRPKTRTNAPVEWTSQDERFHEAMKKAAKEILTGAQYAAIIARTQELVKEGRPSNE